MKNIKPIIPILFGILLFLLLTGCMTSRGSLFNDVASSDSFTSSDTDDIEEENPGLYIKTVPSNADIYIDDSFAGVSPVTQYPESGNYRITAKIEGYYTTTEWVNYTAGESVSLKINLEPVTGFLNLSVSPDEAIIKTGWDNLYKGLNEIQIGRHFVKAELFGYKTWEKQITIYENKTSNLKIKMEPAEFELSDPYVNRRAFNPANPAVLGRSKISFEVSTYGTGELIIYTESGQQILTKIFPYFEDWNQSFIWNGKNNYGEFMPDGVYKIVISGRDMNGENSSSKELYVTIDSSLIIRIRTTLNGTSGTMFCPSPDTLPWKSFQAAVSSFGHIGADTYRFPFTVSTRIVPGNKLEITGQAGIVIMPETSESYFLSASVKRTVIDSKVGDISWYIKGSYQNNHYTDRNTNFTGLSAGLPMSISVSSLTLLLTPELIVSPFRISYDETEYDAGIYAWGYVRAALMLDMGSAMVGISTALRLTPYSLDINSGNPLSAGIELNWLIPGTGIFITGIMSGEFSSTDNFYINAGGGIGIIN
jgi:PEGA domain